jgi:hypothetical protein
MGLLLLFLNPFYSQTSGPRLRNFLQTDPKLPAEQSFYFGFFFNEIALHPRPLLLVATLDTYNFN